jgi:hypothetical protein
MGTLFLYLAEVWHVPIGWQRVKTRAFRIAQHAGIIVTPGENRGDGIVWALPKLIALRTSIHGQRASPRAFILAKRGKVFRSSVEMVGWVEPIVTSQPQVIQILLRQAEKAAAPVLADKTRLAAGSHPSNSSEQGYRDLMRA